MSLEMRKLSGLTVTVVEGKWEDMSAVFPVLRRESVVIVDKIALASNIKEALSGNEDQFLLYCER